MTQSPQRPNVPAADDKTLVKGVGYVTVFWSSANKFELSAKGTSLRKTIYSNEIKQGEYLYVKIEEPDEIRRIEESNSAWKTYDGTSYGYIVRGQLNKRGKLTGCYKIVESGRVNVKRNLFGQITSIDSSIRDWTYYKRRTVNG